MVGTFSAIIHVARSASNVCSAPTRRTAFPPPILGITPGTGVFLLHCVRTHYITKIGATRQYLRY